MWNRRNDGVGFHQYDINRKNFFRKSGKNNINRVKLTNRTPFVNMNPLSRNPGSAPVVEDIEYSVDKSKN